MRVFLHVILFASRIFYFIDKESEIYSLNVFHFIQDTDIVIILIKECVAPLWVKLEIKKVIKVKIWNKNLKICGTYCYWGVSFLFLCLAHWQWHFYTFLFSLCIYRVMFDFLWVLMILCLKCYLLWSIRNQKWLREEMGLG